MSPTSNRIGKWRLLAVPLLLIGLAISIGVASASSPGSPDKATPRTSPQNAPLDSWTQKAPYPIPIYGQACAAQAGTLLYCFGGETSNYSITAMAYKYSFTTDSWTPIADLPQALFGASAVSDGGSYIYILNGSDSAPGARNTLYRYDTYNNTYEVRASSPLATYGQGAIQLNGKIYRVGGQQTGGSMTATVDVYDTSTNTWAAPGTAANYPQTISSLPMVSYGGFFYGIGGNWGMGGVSKTYGYDPGANTWDDAAITDLPATREGAAAAILDGSVVVAGGFVGGGNSASVLAMPMANPMGTWIDAAPLPQAARSDGSYGMLGMPNTLFVVGGWDFNGATQNNQAYTGPPTGTLTATHTSTPVPPITPSPTATATCTPLWQVVPSFNTDGYYLEDMVVISPSDIWAVGWRTDYSRQTLTIHWNGTRWSIVPSPNPSASDNTLQGVDAYGTSDVWAVGSYIDVSQHSQTLAMHWDGSVWSVVPTPAPGAIQMLTDVAVVGPNDVWAVGYYLIGGRTRMLTIDWNGTSWNVVPSPLFDNEATYLFGIAVVAPNDIWAVGYCAGAAGSQTLTVHWDGWNWAVEPSPNPSPGEGISLAGVSAAASNYVWAVGYYWNGNVRQTLTLYWYGSQWVIVPSPNPSASENQLTSVDARAVDDVWAVGWRASASGSPQTLAMHFDGADWRVVNTPNPSSLYDVFTQVTATGAADVWAVGYHTEGDAEWQGRTLVERYSDPCVPPPPTSTAISTGTSTVTTTGTATTTTTATATSCTIQYPDVPVGSTFYQYVHCLACRGIISGYPDGTFDPANPVTRGQLSKIVSNSAGYSQNFTTNTFQDVAVGSTFFPYIERLYAHGVIQGYACGNPEPCVPPANKPYFRPGANVTRGQTSKIVASAKGLPAPPSGQQTFADLPEGSTFWAWIEALVSTGAIQGYACGGPGEPCVPPTNRPYFRPGANVTRGQSAKIVSNTFFVNCSTPAVRK